MDNVRVLKIERKVRRQAIALFGDSRGHQLDRRARQTFKNGFDIFRPDQNLAHGADDPVADLLIENGQGVEAVLWLQSITYPGRMQRYAADAPALVCLCQCIEISRLVGTVEGAGAEMDHADIEGGGIIGWLDCTSSGERSQREHIKALPHFSRWRSRAHRSFHCRPVDPKLF